MPTFRGIRTANHPNKVRLMKENQDRYRLIRQLRMASPEVITLDTRLVLDLPVGSPKRSTLQRSPFILDVAKLAYQNERELRWESTITCNVSRLEFLHPWIASGEVLMQADLSTLTCLSKGDTMTFAAGSIMISVDAVLHYDFPSEDHVIEEEPDAIDWQKMLLSTAKPRRKRR